MILGVPVVARKLIVPVNVLVINDRIVKLPYTFSVADPAKVNAPVAGFVNEIFEQFAVAAIVQV